MYVWPFPSYLKLSFKKLSQYLRNKDEFLINNYGKNSNTFIGKPRTLFNNLPYQIRSISSFKSFSREVKEYLLDQAQAKYSQRHFYLHSHFERIFSILQFTHLLDSIDLCWFNALCNPKLARYIYYRCSFGSFSILQLHCDSKFARVVLYPYKIPVCHLLI